MQKRVNLQYSIRALSPISVKRLDLFRKRISFYYASNRIFE